ncbi:MAG TPA: NUDIX domain-containing protein [Candidatus Paceibacterota bacterium]|nr:NUDIX domain-containing protein [Candidatus Paceibacterota bacterium]
MKIPIVNKSDEIVRYKERYETTTDDIRRIIILHVFNENDEVLLAKRCSQKIIDPDKWGPSVAGTVEEGYDYDSTVIKEAEEEIGLKNIKPIFITKLFYEVSNAKRFAAVYYYHINSKENEIVLQEEEVAEVKWIGFEELDKWFTAKPEEFVPSFSRAIETIKIAI